MMGFSALLQELHPNLREQFLSVTFDHCEALGGSNQAADLLNGLGTEIIIQMLRYAKADGRKISPSLISLIQKLEGLPHAIQRPSSAAPEPKPLSDEGVRSLLRREDYDTFVDREYDDLLQALAGKHYQAEPIDALSDALANGLDNTSIDCHIGNALTRLMAISGDAQGYRDWARQLTLTLDDLVDDGAFDCLSDILTFALEENGFQTDPEKKRVTGLVLNRFSDPQFVANVIRRLEDDPDMARKLGAGLMGLIGDAALVEVLDALSPKDSPAQIQAKMNLLAPFGRRGALAALERLNDPRPAYLCLMVRVIRWLGDVDLVEGVRALIKHEHRDVRLEALGALLKFRNGWGLARLGDLTGSGWTIETQRSLELAAAYKVKEAVPMLVSRLRRWGAGEPEQCRTLLVSLGRIGDPAALPTLNKLARRRWSFSKKKLRYLQRCLFESLGGYPYSNVADLIHFGLKHKDDFVRDTCRKLLEGFHRKAPSNGNPSSAAESS